MNDRLSIGIAIAQTIAWCTQSLSHEIGYRSEIFSPTTDSEHFIVPWESAAQTAKTVDTVVQERAVLLALGEIRSPRIRSDRRREDNALIINGGRLLVFDPFFDVDGVDLSHDSDGFLTCKNEPPWDTWFQVTQYDRKSFSCAIWSWVPPEVLSVVEMCLRALGNYSLAWAEDIFNTVVV